MMEVKDSYIKIPNCGWFGVVVSWLDGDCGLSEIVQVIDDKWLLVERKHIGYESYYTLHKKCSLFRLSWWKYLYWGEKDSLVEYVDKYKKDMAKIDLRNDYKATHIDSKENKFAIYGKLKVNEDGTGYGIDMEDPEVQAKIYEQAMKCLPKEKSND